MASAKPHATSLLAPGRANLSYGRLLEHAAEVERTIRQAGVGPDDVIACALPNGPEAASAFLCFAAACIFAPLNPDDDENAITVAIQQLTPKAIILRAGVAAAARDAAIRSGIPIIELSVAAGAEAGVFRLDIPQTGPPQPCEALGAEQGGLLLQTSGTTGRPRFVRHHQRSIYWSTRLVLAKLQLTPEDRCLNIAPMFHTLGIFGVLLNAIVSGGSVVCTPGFDSHRFFGWLEEYSPSWYAAVPAVHRLILALAPYHQEILRAHPLRFCRSGGAPMHSDQRQALEDALHTAVVQAYGMSESAPIAIDPMPPAVRKPGSVGKVAVFGIEIWDDDDTPVPAGCKGNVVVRGPQPLARILARS